MSSFFSPSVNSSLGRPPTAAQRSAELRHKVHKLRPIVTLAPEVTDKNWMDTKRSIEDNKEIQKPSFVLASLKTELLAVGNDPLRRVAAHRRAFESMVSAADGSAQEVFRLIFEEYERSAFKGVADTYNLLLAKKDEADRLNRSLLAENSRMERHIAEMELHTLNLERRLKRQSEELKEISSQYCVPLRFSNTNDESSPDNAVGTSSHTRTLTDIRAHQETVRVKVAGLDGKDSLTREKLEAIDRQLAADCAEAESALGVDISKLSGVTAATDALHLPVLECANANEAPKDTEGAQPAHGEEIGALRRKVTPRTAAEMRAQHPLRSSVGFVCANLEDDADEYLAADA